jgi:hypothetical protein
MRNGKPIEQLVDAKHLLELWDEASRPSMQWIRKHTGRDIPAIKIGRLYFYSPDKVRAVLGL